LKIANNTDTTNRDDSLRKRVTEGVRDTEMTVTTVGESQSYGSTRRSLQNLGGDIVWTFANAPTGNGTITLATAKLTDPGTGSVESGQATYSLDEKFAPEGGGTSGLAIA